MESSRVGAVRVLALALALASIASNCATNPSGSEPATAPTVTMPTPRTSTTPTPTTTDTTVTGRETTTTSTTSTTPPLPEPTFASLDGIDTILDFTDYTSRGFERWEQSVPEIQDIRIVSTADGSEQPALWLPPAGDRDRPLLVILHSWSSDYLQHAGIPYGLWAAENGWGAIAPQFRGVNDDPDALGSDLAVQDVVDAIDYATSREGVDPERVYAVGYSGGGMMALLLAGRHPDEVTAVAAWGPPYDLLEFYRTSVETGRRYVGDIQSGCGGDPIDNESARQECLGRSPMTHLDGARAQDVPVFIGQGISDTLVSPRQGARAFNQLADEADRLSDATIDQIDQNRLPDDLSGSITTETFFGEGDPEPVFARRSDDVWLVYFASGHDMVYEATVRWFVSEPE